METDLDSTPLNFGMHSGRTPDQVAVDDPSYIVWMYEKVHPKKCSKELYTACRQDLEEQEENQASAREGFPD